MYSSMVTDHDTTSTAGAAGWTCHVKWIQHRSRRWRETAATEAHILACCFAFDSTTCRWCIHHTHRTYCTVPTSTCDD